MGSPVRAGMVIWLITLRSALLKVSGSDSSSSSNLLPIFLMSPKLSTPLMPRMRGDDKFLKTVTCCIIFFPPHSIGKRYSPSGINGLPLAALASLIGVLIFVGLLLIGIALNLSVDIHVMLAPVSYSHLSFIIGHELISTIGLASSDSVTSLIFRTSLIDSLKHVCLKRLIIDGSPSGLVLSGGFGSGGMSFCSWC